MKSMKRAYRRFCRQKVLRSARQAEKNVSGRLGCKYILDPGRLEHWIVRMADNLHICHDYDDRDCGNVRRYRKGRGVAKLTRQEQNAILCQEEQVYLFYEERGRAV